MKELIAKLDALYEKATRGPWTIERKKDEYEGTYSVSAPSDFALMGDPHYYPYAPNRDTAEFLVALVNAYPQLREMARDAERYRWLREHTDSMSVEPPLTVAKVAGWGLDAWSGDNLDAAIDAAMRGGDKSALPGKETSNAS